MRLLYPESLAQTVDAISDAHFHRRALLNRPRLQAAVWIASRQDGPGSYARMFAPTPQDARDGVRVFTGELADSGAGAAHILGEEACRALTLLSSPTPGVQEALARARAGILARLVEWESQHARGMYCCGKCSVALWRHLLVGGLPDAERRLVAGVRALREHRTGDGKWRVFPFFYTLLALLEMNSPLARAELQYAAPLAARYLHRKPTDLYGERRREVAKRALARC